MPTARQVVLKTTIHGNTWEVGTSTFRKGIESGQYGRTVTPNLVVSSTTYSTIKPAINFVGFFYFPNSQRLTK